MILGFAKIWSLLASVKNNVLLPRKNKKNSSFTANCCSWPVGISWSFLFSCSLVRSFVNNIESYEVIFVLIFSCSSENDFWSASVNFWISRIYRSPYFSAGFWQTLPPPQKKKKKKKRNCVKAGHDAIDTSLVRLWKVCHSSRMNYRLYINKLFFTGTVDTMEALRMTTLLIRSGRGGRVQHIAKTARKYETINK